MEYLRGFDEGRSGGDPRDQQKHQALVNQYLALQKVVKKVIGLCCKDKEIGGVEEDRSTTQRRSQVDRLV